MRGHVRKRGGKWAVIVENGRDDSGRRKQKWHSGYNTRKDAQAALTEILGRIQANTYIEPSKQTLASYLHEWLPAVRARLRESTWVSYSLNVESHIIPRLGSLPLQALTASTLNAFYGFLLKDGRRKGAGGLSPRTTRYVHTILRKALQDAVEEDRLARNVADRAKPPQGKSAREMRTWSGPELRMFLEHVRGDRLYAAWMVAATTGLRRGEICGLRWRDVDLRTDRIAVTQALLAIRRELVTSAPKTAKSRRSVALDPRTAAVLKAHRRTQLEERLAWGSAYEDRDFVFCREDGSPVHPDHFSDMFEHYAKAAGLPAIRLHDLRHTHASLALQAGVHPKIVSERLGHSTISITLDTYSHAIPAMEEEAAAKVAAVVFG